MVTCIIDKDGFIITSCIEVKDTTAEDICVPVCNDYGIVKPKWDGIKWIESATPEEIADAKKPTGTKGTPTEEVLYHELAQLKVDSMKKDKVLEALQKRIDTLEVSK